MALRNHVAEVEVHACRFRLACLASTLPLPAVDRACSVSSPPPLCDATTTALHSLSPG